MTRKHVAAMRRTERQRQHRSRTGGLVARAHVEHEREVPDSRHPRIIRSELLLESLIQRNAAGDIVTDFADGDVQAFDVIEPCARCGSVGLDPCRKPNGRVADKAHAGRVTS